MVGITPGHGADGCPGTALGGAGQGSSGFSLPAIVPLCSSRLVNMGLLWAGGPCGGPGSSPAGCCLHPANVLLCSFVGVQLS